MKFVVLCFESVCITRENNWKLCAIVGILRRFRLKCVVYGSEFMKKWEKTKEKKTQTPNQNIIKWIFDSVCGFTLRIPNRMKNHILYARLIAEKRRERNKHNTHTHTQTLEWPFKTLIDWFNFQKYIRAVRIYALRSNSISVKWYILINNSCQFPYSQSNKCRSALICSVYRIQ